MAARARKPGLINYARLWSTHDDQRLMALTARESTLQVVAQTLGRTPEAIRRRASRLGVEPPAPAPVPRHARRWTREEDEALGLHHALNPARVAELLGRSDVAVCRRLRAIGVRAHAQCSPTIRATDQSPRPPRAALRKSAGSQSNQADLGPIQADSACKAVALGAGAMRMYGSGAR